MTTTTPADGWPTLACYRDVERTWATLGLDLVTTHGHAALTGGLLGLALQMGQVVQHVFTSNCLETSMITRDVTGELKVILILAVEQSMVSF